MPAIAKDAMTEAQANAAAEVERNGTVPAYLWPTLRNPGLARPTQMIGEYLNREGKLPPRLTQMVILIVSRQLLYNGSWIEHSGMADRAGLNRGITVHRRDRRLTSAGLSSSARDSQNRSCKDDDDQRSNVFPRGHASLEGASVDAIVGFYGYWVY